GRGLPAVPPRPDPRDPARGDRRARPCRRPQPARRDPADGEAARSAPRVRRHSGRRDLAPGLPAAQPRGEGRDLGGHQAGQPPARPPRGTSPRGGLTPTSSKLGFALTLLSGPATVRPAFLPRAQEAGLSPWSAT